MELISVSAAAMEVLTKANSAVLREVERKGNVEVKVNPEGHLEVEGEGGDVWIASQVLKALDFGFQPRSAYKLFNDNYFLEIIDLELVFSNPKAVERYKGRVIGAEGRAKKTIEELSGAFIAISGNRVALLGEFEDLQLAKQAVVRLLEGAQHSTVYAFLERKNRERKYNLK